MQKIGFTTSPYIVIITLDKIAETIDNMAHDIPTIC